MVKRMFWTGVLINAVLFVLLWMWRNSVVEFVAGAFFAMWMTALIGALEHPDLLIQIRTPGGKDLGWQAGGHRGVVLQLRVSHKPLGSPMKYLFQRASASEIRGWIRFRKADSGDKVGSDMPIRWSNSPQPWYTVLEQISGGALVEKSIYNPDRLTTVRSVPPGDLEEGAFDVAARFYGESECYGVNNESYRTKWHTPQWTMAEGRYIVEVRITGSNASSKAEYLLVNEGALPEGFRLEPSP